MLLMTSLLIDGFKETHNRLRGGDIFDGIIENIQRSANLKIFARITANNQNDGVVQIG